MDAATTPKGHVAVNRQAGAGQVFEEMADGFQDAGILRESTMGGKPTAQGLGRERPRTLSKLHRA